MYAYKHTHATYVYIVLVRIEQLQYTKSFGGGLGKGLEVDIKGYKDIVFCDEGVAIAALAVDGLPHREQV
jgi:hypothetical protein